MTGRTHDLAAFTTLTVYIATQSLPHMTFATAIAAFGGNMVGGVMPDIDDATSDFWKRIPAGSFIGKIIHPFIGHHRMISHSILGMVIAGYLVKLLLHAMNSVILVDMNVVWWTTMFGYASHLVMDFITKEGIPWFFPIPVRFGFPPFTFMRIRTGSWVETFLVFPALLLANGYLIYIRYPVFFAFMKSFGK